MAVQSGDRGSAAAVIETGGEDEVMEDVAETKESVEGENEESRRSDREMDGG